MNKTHLEMLSKDFRVASVRTATAEECEGERGWTMIELREGCTFEGASKFLTTGVREARRMLALVTIVEK